MSAATLLGRALTQTLRGLEPSWPATPPPEEIVERHDVEAALLWAWRSALPRRVRDAAAADAVAVVLADGSSVDVARAEALLADKEGSRVYPPLRLPLARATRPFRRCDQQRADLLRALLIDDDVIAAADLKGLTSFLASTTGEMTACRELLASIGGVGLDDEDAVARGLDLPAPALFNESVLAGLVRQALPALPPGVRLVQRVAAPRACAGHVVADDDDDGGLHLRLWTAPSLAAGRFIAGARGAGRLLALAAGNLVHAPGLGLCVVDVEARRALSEARGDATRALQIVVATSLLLARARAATALVAARRLDLEEEREEARGAVRQALGADGGAELGSALLLPPLPDGLVLRSPLRALLQQAAADVDVAASWLTLREALDAGCLLRPRRLEALRELPASSLDPALAWRRLLGELL